MTAPPEANVEQVFFGWSRDGGGLGPLASSYPHPGEMHRWHARLQKHLRLQPMPGAPVPSAAFSYFVFDGIAVLVRRVSAGVSSGRNNSQALIADEDVLDFYAAIGMSIANWPDDPPENAPIRPLRADNVQGTRSRAQSLAAIVGKYDNHVGIVLAGLLADPTRPLSVIGGDDRAALATVWALHEAAIRYLPRRFAGRRDWSYSTYEDKHDAAAGELPGIVFLPTAQPGAGAVNRTIVDLSRQPLVDEAGLALAHRVIHYLVNDMTPDDTIDDTPVRKQPGMTSGPVTMPSPRPAPVAPVSSATAPAEHSPVEALLAAVTVDDFNRELDRLEQRRSILYTSIDVAALDDLARFVEVDARNELLGRLLKLTYGQRLPGALHEPEAQKHAVKLIKRGQSDQLARMLGAAAPAGEPIREAAFERWTAGAGKPPGETNGSMSTRLRVARHSRYFWWIAGGAAVLALALVFVLGFLTGRPGNAAAPAASPAVATKAAVPTTKAPTEATQAPTQAPTQATQNNSQQNDQNQNQNAGVPVASRAGQDVWMFRPAKDGRDFFPLELCQPKSDTSWTCTPTASDGDSIVAMAVPRNSSQDLADKAKNGGKTEPQNDWSQTTQVK